MGNLEYKDANEGKTKRWPIIHVTIEGESSYV